MVTQRGKLDRGGLVTGEHLERSLEIAQRQGTRGKSKYAHQNTP
jgi:hypothetical protein